MASLESCAARNFWLLTGLAFGLLGAGFCGSWGYVYFWIESLWRACQQGLTQLTLASLISWQMVVPLVMIVVLARTILSLARQVQAGRRLDRLFRPLQQPPPPRLKSLLAELGLTSADVVYLDLAGFHAFCLGFWRPRIWLTTGLLDLLANDELAAVLAHEAHHLRRRDPLRLLISRAFRTGFFFLPLLADLAREVEVEQEVEADRQAITHCGDDLPLLRALQTLIQPSRPHQASLEAAMFGAAAFTAFNLTEARLKRLLYPSPPINWSGRLFRIALNLGIIALLGSTIYLSCPARFISQRQTGACFDATAFTPHASTLTQNNYR